MSNRVLNHLMEGTHWAARTDRRGLLCGFLVGYCLSVIGLTSEDMIHGIGFLDAITDYHHQFFPIAIGSIIGFLGYGIGKRNMILNKKITDKVTAEDVLRESAEKFTKVFKSSPAVLAITTVEQGEYIEVNQAFEELTGYTNDEVAGRTSRKIGLWEDPKDRDMAIELFKEQGFVKNYNIKIKTKSKDIREGLISIEPLNILGMDCKISTFVDITEQKKAKVALRETMDRFEMVTEQSPSVYELYDMDGLQIEVNKAYEELWQFPRETSVNKFNVLKSKEVEDTGLMVFVKRAYAGELVTLPPYRFDPTGATEAQGVGRVRWLSTRIYPLKDINGNVTNIVITHEDVSDKVYAEKLLKESEQKHRTLISNISDVIAVLDREGVITYKSPNITGQFGWDPDELIGRHGLETVHPDDRERIGRELAALLATEGAKTMVQYKYLCKDGSSRPIELTALNLMNDPIINGVLLNYKDITERVTSEEKRKKLEEQLFESQKMESIGRLAGGIAHDFNNILSVILGYAEMLKLQLSEDTQQGAAVDAILKSGNRAADLIRQLLGFARGGRYNPVPLNINDEIREIVKVSGKIFEKNINVTYTFAEDINTIEADKNQLDQVLTNLIINAKDAMPEQGTITFETSNVRLDGEDAAKYLELQPGRYVRLSITDTGVGMTKQVQEKVFEPFYSTKGEGKGTGLGLAMVYGIIKKHMGRIHCYSEPGKGTTFTIHLPASDKEIATVEPLQDEIIKGQGQTVLVVDDEEEIRNATQTQLELMGYNVITASDGAEAVSIYEKRGKEVALVLLDMIMPVMAGKETYQKVKELDPQARVVLMSGFSQDDKSASILKDGALEFLNKPFSMLELSKAVHIALKQ